MFGPGRPWGLFAPSTATTPPTPAPTLVPAVGPAGVATLVLELEPGARLVYSWATEVHQSYSGREQRISWQSQPSLRIDGQAFAIDADDRVIRAALMRNAAAGATFLLALPTEELICTTATTGTTLAVGDTSIADWALPGQRAIVLAPDGSTLQVVVQSATASTLTFNVAVGALGRVGARVMPLVPILLDPQQGFTRHPTTVHLWDVRARATSYGWAGVDAMGGGATVLTFDAGPLPAASLTDDSLMIWDAPNAIDGTANETLISRVDTLDLGGAVEQASGGGIADWVRPIKLRSPYRDDLQWLKAVVHQLRGRQGVFLLPTGRPDFLPVSIPAYLQLLIGGDYASWFASVAHRRLVLEGGGLTQYVTVTDVVDNGDGTNTLTLDDAAIGPVTKVSLLETVRLESDDVAPVWSSGVMTVDLAARVVQDDTATGDTLTTIFAGHGLGGDFTFPVGNYTMTEDLNLETGSLQSGSVVITNGFVLRCRTALIFPAVGLGVIQGNGRDASGATAGVGWPEEGATSDAGTLGGGSGSGATGGNGSGTTGGFTVDSLWPATGHPGTGGAGGGGTNPGGGVGFQTVADPSAGSLGDPFSAERMKISPGGAATGSITGGCGGSSGGGSGTQPGGGGGAGGRNVVVCAGRVVNAQNGLITSIGGRGGNGTAVNCGGGGGGGGGDIALFVGRLPFPATDVSGGAGGAGGGGTGAAGNPGSAGTVFLFVG